MTSSSLSDAALAASVADVVSRPRSNPADSFVLHAPLELAARYALLPHVRPDARDAARERISEIATQLDAFAEPIADPAPREFTSLPDGAAFLAAALEAGDLDAVDEAAAWLGRVAQPADLRTLLADAVLPRLSAAAHAPIFLYLLPRVAPRCELTGALLRPLARELARFPEWRLTWHHTVEQAPDSSPEALFDALSSTPFLGVPGSDFIFPLMSQAERDGFAASVLGTHVGAVDIDAARHVILRAAALSMLLEPPDHAPYGWSHCLTMPQAALGIAHACANPHDAVAVAATFVVGFRAAMATTPLGGGYAPEAADVALTDAFDAGSQVAAAAAWHASTSDVRGVITEIATRAAVHHDAHLVKYTLACIDAAADDRDNARLYFAAAASLAGTWATRALPADV